jgi:hypothetical protein
MVPRSESQLRPPALQRNLSANSAKQSYRSHSSSFEADDERSRSSDHEMGPDAGFRDDPSQYAGEDTRLTSRKELSGWYAYGFAAEVFVICGIGESVLSTGSKAESATAVEGRVKWMVGHKQEAGHSCFGASGRSRTSSFR